MKEILYFTCDHIVIISSKALHQYPHLSDYDNPLLHAFKQKSMLFFAYKEKNVSQEQFNTLASIGFASVSKHPGNTVLISPISGTANVKRTILEAIRRFITVPAFLEVDIKSNSLLEDLEVYIELGFGTPTANISKNVIVVRQAPELGPSDENEITFKKMMMVAQTDLICTATVMMSNSLAKSISEGTSKMVEFGGGIQILKYINDYEGLRQVGILGVNPETVFEGEEAFINIPSDVLVPFSFHCHTDVSGHKNKLFSNWPSVLDMVAIVNYYLEDRNILGHFIAAPSGIWVIHIKPVFQRVLYNLKNNKSTASAACKQKILSYLSEAFSVLATYAFTSNSPAFSRTNVLDWFIETCKTIKISNLPFCEIGGEDVFDDGELFDVDLIKWSQITTKPVILSFTYIVDPKGGLPGHLQSEEEKRFFAFEDDIEMSA
jgi:hypothetical protein